MNINILAFGIAKDILNAPVISLVLTGSNTTGALKVQLEALYPELGKLRHYMVAVNNEYAADDTVINAGDEVAIIPPVSGG